MNKNKLTALCLAALLSCSLLAGCNAQNKGAKTTQNNSPLPEGAVTAEVTPEQMQELIDQGVIEDPNTPTEVIDPAPYTKGVVEGNVYKNEACNLTLRIPTGWNVEDDYNLCSSYMGITYDFEDNSKNLEAISKLADIYDMAANNATGDSTIRVLMQDLKQYSLDVTPEEYLEIMKLQFISDSITFDIGDISEVSYSGNTYAMMKVISTPNEGDGEATQYFYVREANGRMLTVMLSFPSVEPINPDTIFA